MVNNRVFFRKNTRPDWKKERQTNQETFGHSAVRSLTYRRGPRPLFSNGRPTQNNMPLQRGNAQFRGNYNNAQRYHQNQYNRNSNNTA